MKRALRRRRETKRIRDVREPACAVVQEQHRLDVAHQHEILMARVAQVGEQAEGRIVQDIQAGFVRDIAEMAVSIVLIQAVGQASGLKNVDLVPAVAVDIRNGDPELAIEIDTASRIETRPPERNCRATIARERMARP